MPASNNEGSPKGGPGPKSQAFTSPPSTRALGLVAIAILVGFLLIMIVDSDNSAGSKKEKASASETTTTAATQTTSKLSASTTSSTTTPVTGTKKPAEVTVLVLNGSNVTGVAATVTTDVSALGYKTLTAGSDASKDKGTFVYYKSGFEKDAKQLATNIVPGLLSGLKISQTVKTAQFPASAPVDWDQKNLVGANIVIIIGNNS